MIHGYFPHGSTGPVRTTDTTDPTFFPGRPAPFATKAAQPLRNTRSTNETISVISLLNSARALARSTDHRVCQRRSAEDLSGRALAMNIAANTCFLVYSASHAQWPIALNNVAVIALDGTLLALRRRSRGIKKRSSETDLTLLEQTAAGPPASQ